MLKIKEKHIFIFYMVFFFLVTASVALFQPIQDAPPLFANPPDEHARYLIPQFICKYGKIPTGFEEEIRIPSYGFSYGFYNVFPYIVQGYVMRFASLFTSSELILLYVARFVNVFSGTAMAAVVYAISKKVFEDRRFGWLFSFAVMFLPQSLFMHTYVNTDSMCLLSTALIVYGLVSAYKEGFTYKNSIWLSVGIALCALSYYNAYGFILSSILLFIVYFYNGTKRKISYDYRGMLKIGIFISVLVLIGIGWWFVRSYILYDGDILGLKTRELIATEYAIDAVNPMNQNTYKDRGYTVWQMLKETNFFTGAYISFVAAYGSMSITANIWLYRMYKLFFYAGVGGYFLLIPFYYKEWKEQISFKRVFFHINMIFCAVMPIILTVRYSYTMDFQNQGRYLLPMIIPLMYYATAGTERILKVKRVPVIVTNIAVVAMQIMVIVGILVMVYGYAFPAYINSAVTS